MKLSICLRGRNDNYGTSFIEKAKFTIYRYVSIFNALKITPDDVEIIFVDWGSNIPLYTIFPGSNMFVRYITVPNSITKCFDPPETKFSFVHSINVGIARAKGDNILHADPDVYTDQQSIQKLYHYLDFDDAKKYQHYFTRFCAEEKNYKGFFNDPDSDHTGRLTESVHPLLAGDNMFNGYSTAVMASKEAWYKVGGYNEKYIYWGAQDIELHTRFLLTSLQSRDLFETHEIKFIHMEHNRLSCGGMNNTIYNPKDRNVPINPNGDNWGLKNINFDEVIK